MLSKQETGLIIVDIQGKLARMVDDSDAMIARCRSLIQGAQILGLPIIWLEQNPEKLGKTVDELQAVLGQESPISKMSFGACGEPDFMEALQSSNRNSWLLCGIESHICVYQTASEMKALGYDVHIVCDCISSRKAEDKALAIQKLSLAGVTMTNLEMCFYEMLRDCRAPEFKDILNLVKQA